MDKQICRLTVFTGADSSTYYMVGAKHIGGARIKSITTCISGGSEDGVVFEPGDYSVNGPDGQILCIVPRNVPMMLDYFDGLK